MKIECRSFGFKNGADAQSDFVFDVRCLPNPFYDNELRNLTGLDKSVRDYVLQTEEAKTFSKKLIEFIDCSLPLYMKEGKSRLCIAIGCTGGKHRSVTFAEIIHKHLTAQGYHSITVHRDIKK